MIATIIIVSLALAWLLYETDFMRVRLLVGSQCLTGKCCEWRLPNSAVTDCMKDELVNMSKTNGKLHNKGEFCYHIPPLCGWGFAYQFRNFTPEYKIELIAPGSHYTFRTANTEILRDAFRVYRNPYLKVKIKNAQA